MSRPMSLIGLVSGVLLLVPSSSTAQSTAVPDPLVKENATVKLA